MKSKKRKRDRSLYMTNTKGYIFLVRPCGMIVAIKALLDGAEGETVVSAVALLYSSIWYFIVLFGFSLFFMWGFLLF